MKRLPFSNPALIVCTSPLGDVSFAGHVKRRQQDDPTFATLPALLEFRYETTMRHYFVPLGLLALACSRNSDDASSADDNHGVCRGDRVVQSERQLANLVAERCREITGSLNVTDNSAITSLAGLDTLETIGRSLYLEAKQGPEAPG